MTHEVLKEEAMTSYHTAENNSELWITEESTNPIGVIFRHKILTLDKDLIPKLIAKQ